ncbi:MAG: hypothetical protein EOP51_16260 [Sphingobacteriales bacterium]|nr:MAG: hypothetical protein EOP51_16260 [Sphingobacteriales bacterium]
MYNKCLTVFAFLLLVGSKSFAQNADMKVMEDSLVVTADSMYNAFISDQRIEYNEQFVKQLVRALKMPGSYNYPFTELQKTINIITPDDKKFRIFNWSIAPTDLTRRYYGAIQMNSQELKLYPLFDYSANLGKGGEDSTLTGGKWYGALYYRIIPHDIDGQTVYTLFGLNASSTISNKKLMDPLVITSNGPSFGAPIFNVRSEERPDERVNRFIIEYKKAVQASMNWDEDLNAVYFDKLVSDVNDPNRKYTYVPSGEYDGFKWDGGYWNYVRNLIPIDALKDGQAPTPIPVKGKEEKKK